MRKGFSLTEVLVTMALMSVILGVLSSLFQYASRNIYQTNLRANAMESAFTSFSQLRQDLESAIFIYSPAPGTTSTVVNVTRMSPYNTTLNLPPMTGGSWILHNPAVQWSASYQLQGTTLVRQIKPGNGPAWSSTIADNLGSFSCTIEVDGNGIPYSATLQASVQATTNVVPVKLSLPLHLPPQVVAQ